MSGQKTLLVDIARCSGCYNCQLACKDEHVDNDWRPYSAPQPNVGQFWMKIQEYARGTVPKVKLHYIPLTCAHCEDPGCMAACPAQAIYKREDELVLIDPDKCTGCGACAVACPAGVIYKNEKLGIFQKCTGCAHLADHGEKPRCVDACHSGALKLVDADEARKYAEEGESFVPAEWKPHALYLHIPKLFLAGAVLNQDGSDVVEGVTCRVNGRETVTDGFGDFWFEGLAADTYTLEIRSGSRTLYSRTVELTQSLNLGDIRIDA